MWMWDYGTVERSGEVQGGRDWPKPVQEGTEIDTDGEDGDANLQRNRGGTYHHLPDWAGNTVGWNPRRKECSRYSLQCTSAPT